MTDSTGLYVSPLANFEIFANTAPSIASVSISPDPAFGTDSLACSYTGFADPDGPMRRALVGILGKVSNLG